MGLEKLVEEHIGENASELLDKYHWFKGEMIVDDIGSAVKIVQHLNYSGKFAHARVGVNEFVDKPLEIKITFGDEV